MEPPASTIEALFERTETYGRTTLELYKFKLLETTTLVATSLVSRLSVFTVIAFCIFILSLGIAQWLGELLGKSYYGYFVVAAFYLVAAIILHIFLLRWIKKPLSDHIIKQVLQ